MEFHVIELPKLPNKIKEESNRIELWAKFIAAEKKEEFDMLAERDPYIKSAYQQLQVISQDTEKRLEYEAREKAIRDHNQFLFEAEQRGIKIGEQRGIQAIILDSLEDNLSKEKILAKLQKHFKLTETQAEEYYLQYR